MEVWLTATALVNKAGQVYAIATTERECGSENQAEGRFVARKGQNVTEKKSRSDQANDLRRRAEQKARADEEKTLDTLPPEEARQVFHELRVHQIELEMQNEELRRAQAELEASRARYFDLYDLAPVGYFTLGEQGLILEANLAGAGLLGVTRGDLAKQPMSRFILPED